MNLGQKIVKLARQRSTWRGIMFILMAAGVHIEPSLQNVILGAGLGGIGAMDVLTDDSRRKTDSFI